MTRKFLTMMCSVFAFALTGGATTYYVSMDGNDSNNGKSPTTAFRTVAKGFAMIHDKDSRDELIIGRGHYTVSKVLSFAGEYASGAGPDVARGETGDPADVVIDAEGTCNILNLARWTLVTGITFRNGVSTASNTAGGVRIANATNATTVYSVVSNCVFDACVCTNKMAGAAAYVGPSGILRDCVITNCAVATNSCGVVMVYTGATVSNCTIAANVSRYESGTSGIYGRDGAVNARVIDCRILGNAAPYAAAALQVPTLIGCKISGNIATADEHNGGAVYHNYDGVPFTMTNCLFEANTNLCSDGNAGAMYLTQRGEVTDCQFIGNVASNAAGAVRCLLGDSAVCRFTRCRFAENRALKGGALYCDGQGYVDFDDCIFEGNEAERQGGALLQAWYAKLSLNRCLFTGNRAGDSGGGISFRQQHSGADFAATNCVFASNTAVNYGGGAGIDSANQTAATADTFPLYGSFYSCVFTNNTAGKAGGGFWLREPKSRPDSVQDRPLTFRNCLFARNRVTGNEQYNAGGGIQLISRAYPMVDGCTIVDNDAKYSGGGSGSGLYSRWQITLRNTIVARNRLKGAENSSKDDWFRKESGVIVSNCCVWPLPSNTDAKTLFTSDTASFLADPVFTDFAAGDYTLHATSPCRNKGVNQAWMEDATDLKGDARIFGGTVDMGCYERVYQLGTILQVH